MTCDRLCLFSSSTVSTIGELCGSWVGGASIFTITSRLPVYTPPQPLSALNTPDSSGVVARRVDQFQTLQSQPPSQAEPLGVIRAGGVVLLEAAHRCRCRYLIGAPDSPIRIHILKFLPPPCFPPLLNELNNRTPVDSMPPALPSPLGLTTGSTGMALYTVAGILISHTSLLLDATHLRLFHRRQPWLAPSTPGPKSTPFTDRNLTSALLSDSPTPSNPKSCSLRFVPLPPPPALSLPTQPTLYIYI
ncbi:hypothetical protein R3P38DRAFT_3519278 [Favolaschia claudopus]|uniref:Uncharacterized protein n=1 Tax=Favolaschia claudopus TaxID=2862362 RepID=A0AAW0BQS0_9AGAR